MNGGDCGKEGARTPSEGAATISFSESWWASASPALSVTLTLAEAGIRAVI